MMKAPMGSFFLGPLFLMTVVTQYPHVASPRLAQRTNGIKAPPKWFHFSLTASLKTLSWKIATVQGPTGLGLQHTAF